MAGPVRVIEIRERGQRLFPRSDLVDDSGQTLILPEARELRAVEVRDVVDGVILVALGYIGYLPLTNNITLNIVPKFPIENLWTMLEVGGEDYRNILPTLRSYQTSTYHPPIHLLARSFCHYLKGALSAGFERSYYTRMRTGYYQPRMEFGRTISRYISRGNPVETVSNVFEFGLDSTVNQFVKRACLRFARVVPRTDEWKEERLLLQIALDTLQSVNARELGAFELDFDRSVSFRVRQHYAGMLRVYHLLLTGGGIAFSFAPGGKELPSFLFNLEDIFERFVRQTLVQGLHLAEIAVLDGNKHQGYLFEDSKVYRTKSDLIFRRSRRETIALGEVKYKPRLKEVDRYQIISHVTAAKSPIGILFTPANDGESQRLEHIGRLATGAQIYHYRMNIGGNLTKSQTRMIGDIQTLLSAPLSLVD